MYELQLSELEANILFAVIDRRIAELDGYIEQEEPQPAVVEAALFEQDHLRAIMNRLGADME